MRKTTLALSLLLLSACAQGYTSGTETTPALYPSGLPKITALHITENGKGDAKLCKDFKITQGQALAYFNTAKIINTMPQETNPCSAQGDLTLAFEGPAKWMISSDGYATLTKQNGTELKMFCPRCILGNIR